MNYALGMNYDVLLRETRVIGKNNFPLYQYIQSEETAKFLRLHAFINWHGDIFSKVHSIKNATEYYDVGKLESLNANLRLHHASWSLFLLAEDNWRKVLSAYNVDLTSSQSPWLGLPLH